MLTIPPHIAATGFAGAPITFKETPNALRAAARRDAPKLAGYLYTSTNQCSLAFTAALVEWIGWRLEGPWEVKILLQFAESLWAAQADPAYAKHTLPPGPGESLSSQFIWKVWNNANGQRELVARGDGSNLYAANLSQIAKLVAPDAKVFNKWAKTVLERCVAEHPVTEDQREDRKQCNGPPIAREFVDTTQTFDVSTTDSAIRDFLAGLDPKTNPFLASAQEMTDGGFSGTPYVY